MSLFSVHHQHFYLSSPTLSDQVALILERLSTMSQAQDALAEQINDITDQIQKGIAENTAAQADLMAQIQQLDTISPALQAAVARAKGASQALDDLNVDVPLPGPEPEPVPT